MVNTIASKKVLFRLNGDMKSAFSIALIKQHLGAQSLLEAAVEKIISFDKGDMPPKDRKLVDDLLARARELQAESKPQ